METHGENPERSALGDLFDKARRSLDGRPDVTATKQSTVEARTFFETTQTYVVQTFRQRDDANPEKPGRARDTIFLQFIDRDGGQRLIIPPEVADAIARQRDALTTKSRKRGAQQAMAKRKAAGWVPNFKKRKKKQEA
jgi:hypothetical protein